MNPSPPLILSVFPTDLGWFGLVGCDSTAVRLMIGHPGPDAVRRTATARVAEDCFAGPGSVDDSAVVEKDWTPELRRSLQRYASGVPVEFGDRAIRIPSRTSFQRRVMEVVQSIAYGETATYAEVAREAGRPGAARAVGNVMARNPLPVLVPCHRVVAAGGRLGGYSAPQGIDLKRRLLAMEAEGCRATTGCRSGGSPSRDSRSRRGTISQR